MAEMAGILLLVLFAVVFLFVETRLPDTEWRELAERTGLTFRPGFFIVSPRVSGIFRGRRLILSTFAPYTPRYAPRHTRILLPVHNPAGVYLTLSTKGFLYPLWGAGGIEIGDDRFDARFLTKSKSAEFATGLLASAGLREKLLRIGSGSRIQLTSRELRFEQRGIVTDVDYLLFLFDLLSDLVEAAEVFTSQSVAGVMTRSK